MNQTPENNEEPAILRAADAWQEDGFAVWEAVEKQIKAETQEPQAHSFSARELSQAIYTRTTGNEAFLQDAPHPRQNAPDLPAPSSEIALLLAEIRACREEMGELRAEVAALRRQIAMSNPVDSMPTLLPFASPIPPLHLS